MEEPVQPGTRPAVLVTVSAAQKKSRHPEGWRLSLRRQRAVRAHAVAEQHTAVAVVGQRPEQVEVGAQFAAQ